MYKLSITGEESDDYNKPFKNGPEIHVSKAFKYDKDQACQTEHAEFVQEFMKSAAIRIINDAQSEDYSKAYGWNVKYVKITT